MKAAQIYSDILSESALYLRVNSMWRYYRTQGAEHIVTLSHVGRSIYAGR